MPMLLNPYLTFRDTAEEAMTFYRSVFGGELTVVAYGGLPADVGDSRRSTGSAIEA